MGLGHPVAVTVLLQCVAVFCSLLQSVAVCCSLHAGAIPAEMPVFFPQKSPVFSQKDICLCQKAKLKDISSVFSRSIPCSQRQADRVCVVVCVAVYVAVCYSIAAVCAAVCVAVRQADNISSAVPLEEEIVDKSIRLPEVFGCNH